MGVLLANRPSRGTAASTEELVEAVHQLPIEP
jgi:hypothetical protein